MRWKRPAASQEREKVTEVSTCMQKTGWELTKEARTYLHDTKDASCKEADVAFHSDQCKDFGRIDGETSAA